MSWRALLDPETKAFIADNAKTDVKQLALQKNLPEPRLLVLDQIKARQKAALKMPEWLTHPDIILPASDIIEQASSLATATYKASLVTGQSFADLTTGSGADSLAFSHSFYEGHCIERDETLAGILSHNMPLLTKKPLQIHCASAEEFMLHMDNTDFIYIDPQRRNNEKRGIYKLAECSPNILDLLPTLKNKTKTVMIKTSPMLDIEQGIRDLQYVSAVYVVEHKGECKELLFLLNTQDKTETPTIHAVNVNERGTALWHITGQQEQSAQLDYANPQTYLYEPGPALQKAGLFDALSAQYPLRKLAPNTHLFTTDTHIKDFPGRAFKVINTSHVNKKAITIPKANLTIRNYPETVENLRKKLGIKDGGDDYLFACSLKNNEKTLIHCIKI